jgi:hypothetical protein
MTSHIQHRTFLHNIYLEQFMPIAVIKNGKESAILVAVVAATLWPISRSKFVAMALEKYFIED